MIHIHAYVRMCCESKESHISEMRDFVRAYEKLFLILSIGLIVESQLSKWYQNRLTSCISRHPIRYILDLKINNT